MFEVLEATVSCAIYGWLSFLQHRRYYLEQDPFLKTAHFNYISHHVSQSCICSSARYCA